VRREVVVWTSVGVGVVALLGATVVTLSATVYSPAAFVTGYLDALAAGDVRAAAALPGVGTPSLAAVPIGPADVVVTSSDDHHVRVSYLLSGEPGTATFHVARDGSYLGVFPAWRFATSPLETLAVTALHDDEYTVDGVPTSARELRLLTPAGYTLDHESTMFTATDDSASDRARHRGRGHPRERVARRLGRPSRLRLPRRVRGRGRPEAGGLPVRPRRR
jgi:hypothetical protein